MKYLKDKKSRRRGIAIELAVMLMLVMVASSTIIITTTMIQVNKQKESFSDLTELVNDIEKIEYDQIGNSFKTIIEEEISQIKNLTRQLPTNVGLDGTSIATFDGQTKTNITSKMDGKFKGLKSERNLNFSMNVITEILSSEPSEQEIIKDDEEFYETKDIVLYKYKMTFSLEVNPWLIPLWIIDEFISNLSQTITTMNYYKKVYRINTESLYYKVNEVEEEGETPQVEEPSQDENNIIYIQDGFKLQLCELEGTTINNFEVRGNEPDVSMFIINNNDLNNITIEAKKIENDIDYSVDVNIGIAKRKEVQIAEGQTETVEEIKTITLKIINVKDVTSKSDSGHVQNVTSDEFGIKVEKNSKFRDPNVLDRTTISHEVSTEELKKEKWIYK